MTSHKVMKSRHVVLRLGPFTLRVERRSLLVGAILTAIMATAAVFIMTLGDYLLSPADVVRAVIGTHSNPLAIYFVQELRAPRVVLAILVGAALGMSGCIFQQLTANPLGSPDITGFTTGAAAGALLQIIVFNGGPAAIALAAIIGGFATGALVYGLSAGAGMSGTRFVLVGIGIAAVLQGINQLLIVKASLSAAQTAQQWLVGSFNATTWGETTTFAIAIAVLSPLALVLARSLSIMMTGAEMAVGLGVPVGRRRLQLIAMGVILVAISVAAAGPIAFVALAAPQLARTLSRTSGVGLGLAALMGATLVLLSDAIAQRLFAPTQLPVGVVTGAVGGVYLVWLLAMEWRRKR